jgi:hypothetical protein
VKEAPTSLQAEPVAHSGKPLCMEPLSRSESSPPGPREVQNPMDLHGARRSVHGSWHHKRQLEDAFRDWIHGRARFTHFITLTFRLSDDSGSRTSQQMIESAIRHLLRRLACKAIGRRRMRRHPPIPTVVTVDWGYRGNHPHAHIAIEAPSSLPSNEFEALFNRCASRVRLLSSAPHITNYRDVGAADYLVKHGMDRMVLSLFS